MTESDGASTAAEPLDGVLLSTYMAAVVRLDDGRQLTGPDAMVRLPMARIVHVLTAWNPGGVLVDGAANDLANEGLARALDAAGHQWTSAIGESADDTWREEGFAVPGATRAEMASLAGRFGQLAIYELTDERCRVVRCRDTAVVASGPRRFGSLSSL